MSNNKLEEFLDDENVECPMCMETLDITDRCFKPCKCGYQLCSFCWHHIKENLGGKCPACRQPYNPENYEFLKPNPELVQKLENEKRQQERNKKAHPHSEERRQLANMRVVQRNLVYVTNLAMSIAKEDILKSPSYFGQYGKILKVVVNKNTVYQSPQGPSVSCYITYHRADEALLAIVSVDGATLQGRIVRASFGTTKYCQHFLKVYNGPLTGLPPGQTLQSSGLLNSGAVVRVTCPNPECMYLHELGPLQDSFTKEDMAMGKHLASLDPVIQHILQQAKDAPLTVSGSYKTALPPARQDLLQPLYEQMAAERVKEERAALTSSNEHVTAPSNSVASGAIKTPAKNVWKTLPPTTPVSIASTISSEKSVVKPLSASMTVKPVSKPEPALSTSPKLSSSVSLNSSPSLNSSASLNTSDWPDLLKASAGKDNEQPSEEEEVERVVEPSKKKKSKNSAANNSTTNNSAANNTAANNSSNAASSSDLSASQSALPATARWAKKQKQELADNVPASPASKKHVIVVEQTDTAPTTTTAKTSETADDSWPSLTASGTAPSKEERRESRGKNKKKNREDESAHHSAANNSAGNTTTSANNSAPVTPAVPNKSENDKKKSAKNSSEKSDANNRTSASDSAVKTTAVPSKPRTVIDLDAVPSESDATKHSATTESVDQLQWISAHVSDLVLSDKDTVPVSATSTAPVTPVTPPPGTHTPALTSLFPFNANTSVWTPLKSDAPTALSSLEASLTAQPTPAQTSPRQRSRFQFANQSPAGTTESKNSPNNVPVTSHLFNEEDLRNTFKALLPNVNISFDSNNSFKHEDSANNSTAVNINSLADFPSLKNNAATMPPPHTQPPQSQLMAQLFAAHPMTTPFNNVTPFSANNSNKMYPNSNENQLNELNHTLNTLMFPNAQNAQSFAAPAPKSSGGNWPANTNNNNNNNNNNGVALDSNNPLQALLGMNDSIWHSKQQSHGPNTAANNSATGTGGTTNNSNAGLFYQQLQQLQQLQQMQQPQQQPQQPYFNTFQQPLVTQNLFLINQIQQPSQWPQQQAQYRTAPNNSNAAPSPWGATTPLSYPQQHAINNFPPNGMPHGFNL